MIIIFFFRSFPTRLGSLLLMNLFLFYPVFGCVHCQVFQSQLLLHQLIPFLHRPTSFHLPCTSIFTTFILTYYSSLLKTCPNHLSLVSCIFDAKFVHFNVHLKYSFRSWSFRMIPHIHHSILISTPSILTTLVVFLWALQSRLCTPLTVSQQFYGIYTLTLLVSSCPRVMTPLLSNSCT